MTDRYAILFRTQNGIGGVMSTANINTAPGRKYFDESTDKRLDNPAKVIVDKETGEPLQVEEAVIEKIANDAAEMSGRKRTRNKVSSSIALEV